MSQAYIDAQGNYLGHFSPDLAPLGSTPVAVNPTNGIGSTWDGTKWNYPVPPKPPLNFHQLLQILANKGVIAQADIDAAKNGTITNPISP